MLSFFIHTIQIYYSYCYYCYCYRSRFYYYYYYYYRATLLRKNVGEIDPWFSQQGPLLLKKLITVVMTSHMTVKHISVLVNFNNSQMAKIRYITIHYGSN